VVDAYGLMQIKLETAQDMGFTGIPAQLYIPATNIEYGTKYLRYQLDRYSSDLRKAISAYNAGTYTTVNTAYVNNVLKLSAKYRSYFGG